ncbi:MAG: nucleotidyltransferase [Anaerolineaceae bacterium]|nr:nucleotidyltransferase [Anaerolineaceae bacterium]
MDTIESIAFEVLKGYPVKRAGLFGSAARGDMTTGSDIDMLVEFFPDTRGILFFSLLADLEEAFNRSVDLITFEALQHEAKEHFKKNIQQDVRIIYERES